MYEREREKDSWKRKGFKSSLNQFIEGWLKKKRSNLVSPSHVSTS